MCTNSPCSSDGLSLLDPLERSRPIKIQQSKSILKEMSGLNSYCYYHTGLWPQCLAVQTLMMNTNSFSRLYKITTVLID